MLLILNAGIFYEFISESDFLKLKHNRISIEDVKTGVNYVLIVSTSAGLWGYNTGDTVMFTSTAPFKIIVTGRINQFLSAFGEHVIVREVENAIEQTCTKTGVVVNEFTVAPKFSTDNMSSYHEWFVDFDSEAVDLEGFEQDLDLNMQSQNKYYQDLIQGKVIKSLKIRRVSKNGFSSYMDSIGKLGGQNKIPKISNDRKIADQLYKQDLVIKG